MWSNCIVFLLFLFVIGSKGEKPSHEDALRKQLLKNYNIVALPDTQTNVQVRFSLIHFQMNEQLQSIDLDVWVSMEWKDPRLHWDAEKFPEVSRLAMEANSLWKPDLTLYNSASLVETKGIDVFEPTQILVMPEGKILWVPPAHIKASCVMDMTYWPHDIHNCTAKFGSWVHSQQTIDLLVKDDVINMEVMTKSSAESNLTRSEWEILDTSVVREEKYYSCCPEAYVSVSAILIVKRIATVYTWLIQMPVVVLGLMTVVVFLLPPSASEKVILGIATLVINFIFLFAVSNVIGHNSSHTPLIIKLISKQLVLSGVSVIFSGLILRMVRDPHAKGLPNCFKFPVLVLSSCLCLAGYRQMVTATTLPITRSMKGEDLELNENGGGRGLFPQEVGGGGGENDWILLAAVLDRICLVVFSAIFVINMISYSGILWNQDYLK